MHRPCCSVGRNASFRPNLLSGASLLFFRRQSESAHSLFQEGRKSCKAKITGSQHVHTPFLSQKRAKEPHPILVYRLAGRTQRTRRLCVLPLRVPPEVSTPPIFRKHTIRTACDNESPASNPVTGHLLYLWQRLIRQRKRAYDRLKTRAMNPADDIYQSDSNFQFFPFRFPTYSVYL